MLPSWFVLSLFCIWLAVAFWLLCPTASSAMRVVMFSPFWMFVALMLVNKATRILDSFQRRKNSTKTQDIEYIGGLSVAHMNVLVVIDGPNLCS